MKYITHIHTIQVAYVNIREIFSARIIYHFASLLRLQDCKVPKITYLINNMVSL